MLALYRTVPDPSSRTATSEGKGIRGIGRSRVSFLYRYPVATRNYGSADRGCFRGGYEYDFDEFEFFGHLVHDGLLSSLDGSQRF